MKLNKPKQLLAMAALCVASTSSHASLIYGGVVADSGTGFGTVNTVLTLQNNNGNPRDPATGTSSGAVLRAGGADVTSGNVLPNNTNVHNSTYSFNDLAITQADELGFIFNASEPAGDSIRLDALTMTIYTDMGEVLFSASLDAPRTFADTATGNGKSGFLFTLDAEQAALAQPFIAAMNRIGLAAGISSATGGPDTFYVARIEGDDDGEGPGNEVPEPGSIALLGLGMLGMTALRRRKA